PPASHSPAVPPRSRPSSRSSSSASGSRSRSSTPSRESRSTTAASIPTTSWTWPLPPRWRSDSPCVARTSSEEAAMIRINLLPVRAKKKREFGQQLLVLFVLVLVGGLIGNYLWYRQVDDRLT